MFSKVAALPGARWYSPQLRRWVSRDPIEYRGGENLYAYVGGRPVGWVDPSGLDPDELDGSVMLRDFSAERRQDEAGQLIPADLQPSDFLVPPLFRVFRRLALAGELKYIGERVLSAEAGAIGGKCGVFKGAAQRQNIEAYKNYLRRKLSGKQIEQFRSLVHESKLKGENLNKEYLDRLFELVIKQTKR